MSFKTSVYARVDAVTEGILVPGRRSRRAEGSQSRFRTGGDDVDPVPERHERSAAS